MWLAVWRSVNIQGTVGGACREVGQVSQGKRENLACQFGMCSLRSALFDEPYVRWLCRLFFKPHYTSSEAFANRKDRTPVDVQGGLVYIVECIDCDATYIGETGRKRFTRDMAKATNATRIKTELFEQCKMIGHTFDNKTGLI